MHKTFVIGDIHGAFRALKQCLERSSFDYEHDHLICLGDVTDGWPETKESIDELLKIKNLVYVIGNHDTWTYKWMQTREADEEWLEQGGRATCNSYLNGVPQSHIDLFQNAERFFVDDNRLFVHAGITPGSQAEDCNDEILFWDRTLVRIAMNLELNNSPRTLTDYREVYVGHTPIPSPHPVKYCEVWMMDTGAARTGVLSMMNIESKEWFTSDTVQELYPGIKGR